MNFPYSMACQGTEVHTAPAVARWSKILFRYFILTRIKDLNGYIDADKEYHPLISSYPALYIKSLYDLKY